MDTPSEELRQWRGRVEMAKLYQEHIGNTNKRWDKYTKALASDFGNSNNPEAVDVNMVASTTQLSVAPLHTSDFWITVRPTRMKAKIGNREVNNVEHARFTELEINYWFRELQFREKVLKPICYDSETTNHGYSYLGFVTEEQEHLINTTDKDGEPVGRLEWNPLIKVGSPFIRRHPVRQVLVPKGFPTLDECPWVAVGWQKPKRVVLAQFSDIQEDDLKPTLNPFEELSKASVTSDLTDYMECEDAHLVQLWQIWDQESGQLITIADGYDMIIEKGDWPFKLEGFPICDLSFKTVPDEYYGSPPIQDYWPQQRELNRARTAAGARNNRTKQVIITKKSAIGDTLAQAYAEAEDGTVIQLPISDDEPLSNLITVVQPMQAPSEQYASGQVQMQDIMFITGLGQQARASGDPNIGTATESANVDKWGLVRATDRGSSTRSFIVENAKKLWMIQKQHDSRERNEMIVGEIGSRIITMSYTREQLEGQFNFSLDLGSLTGDNPVRREQLALGNYNLFAGNPKVNQEILIRDVFDSQGKHNVTDYMASRDPDTEFQKMQHGLPVEADIRDDHVSHDQAHEAHAMAIERAIDEMPDDQIDESPGLRLRSLLHNIEAHRNHHAYFMQQLTGKPLNPGEPVSENMARSQVAGASGAITEAEMKGSALNAASPQGGIPGQVSR